MKNIKIKSSLLAILILACSCIVLPPYGAPPNYDSYGTEYELGTVVQGSHDWVKRKENNGHYPIFITKGKMILNYVRLSEGCGEMYLVGIVDSSDRPVWEMVLAPGNEFNNLQAYMSAGDKLMVGTYYNHHHYDGDCYFTWQGLRL